MKILLVEDNLLNQKVVMINLKKFKFDITAVAHGRDALLEFDKHKFDLVLMDIMLPDMKGYEITAEIRNREKLNQVTNPVPIIALTANTYDNDREKCINAGMDDYLAKPFSAQQLIDVVENNIKAG